MKLLLVMSVILTLIIGLTIIPPLVAEEDEKEDDEKELKEIEKEQTMDGEQEQEIENEDGGIAFGSGTGNMILYGTIAAMIAVAGYSGFKIINSKKKPSKSQ